MWLILVRSSLSTARTPLKAETQRKVVFDSLQEIDSFRQQTPRQSLFGAPFSLLRQIVVRLAFQSASLKA